MGQKKFLGADGVHCYFNLKVIACMCVDICVCECARISHTA